ncbi:hypothetical protein AVEN_173853-1 [Araneus ventricosus]|uniref:Uncharacterized protein n=1 Tax=Araneus ventricosus TaxID=182803 RepID=A0A4Y2UY91_ARAVE|nr:hypothetical protein AVEN_173853-1 [Araneus ventricosus]
MYTATCGCVKTARSTSRSEFVPTTTAACPHSASDFAISTIKAFTKGLENVKHCFLKFCAKENFKNYFLFSTLDKNLSFAIVTALDGATSISQLISLQLVAYLLHPSYLDRIRRTLQ